MHSLRLATAGGVLLALGFGAANAAPDGTVVTLTLKDHRFSPAAFTAPAGQQFRIDLVNRDSTADDFDSEALQVDKDVAPHSRVSFFVGPLKAGKYKFKGELHADTAQGEVTVVDPVK